MHFLPINNNIDIKIASLNKQGEKMLIMFGMMEIRYLKPIKVLSGSMCAT